MEERAVLRLGEERACVGVGDEGWRQDGRAREGRVTEMRDGHEMGNYRGK